MSERKLVLRKVADRRDVALEGEVTIGRTEESRLRLTEGSPSRNHARISVAGGGATLVDLGSTNGTFVNGVRLKANDPVALTSGDKLRFDVEEYEFRIEGGEPAADAAKTMLRAPEASTRPNAVPIAAAAAPAPPPPPVAAPAAAAGAATPKRPGSWVDQDRPADNKTKFLTADEIAKMQQSMQRPAAAPAARVSGPHLAVNSGSLAGRTFALDAGDADKAEWTIGSQDDREIVLADSGVSALHAKLVYEGRRWKLMDQMSANGTFVNDKRANISYLGSGDRLRFGPVECTFKLDGGGLGGLLGGGVAADSAPAPAAARDAAASGSGSRAGGGLSKRTLVIVLASFVVTVIIVLVLLRNLT
jgi:pSer/pThr/pTyr-binding forkhead associated (FHA) protein